jgi:hypothetical protein
MPVTVRGTDILFNDGSTQSSAAASPVSLFTGSGSVGDIGLFYFTQNTTVGSGGTVSGSFLFRLTGLTQGHVGQIGLGLSLVLGGDYRNRTTAFNISGTTFSPQGGTWRVLNTVRVTFSSDSYGQSSGLSPCLAVRIS